MELVERKAEVRWLWSKFLVSQRRICELLRVAESSCRYVSRKNDEALARELGGSSAGRTEVGIPAVAVEAGSERAWCVNHKRVYRVYREAGLLIRRKRRKRLRASGFCEAGVDGSEPGMGVGFCA